MVRPVGSWILESGNVVAEALRYRSISRWNGPWGSSSATPNLAWGFDDYSGYPAGSIRPGGTGEVAGVLAKESSYHQLNSAANLVPPHRHHRAIV